MDREQIRTKCLSLALDESRLEEDELTHEEYYRRVMWISEMFTIYVQHDMAKAIKVLENRLNSAEVLTLVPKSNQ